MKVKVKNSPEANIYKSVDLVFSKKIVLKNTFQFFKDIDYIPVGILKIIGA